MATMRPNDPIFTAPGYWIDNRGTEMPVVARYSVWIITVVLFLPFLLVTRLIGLGWLLAVVAALGAAAWLATLASDHLNGEHTVRSWGETFLAMGRTWSRRRREHRRRRPVTYQAPFRRRTRRGTK